MRKAEDQAAFYHLLAKLFWYLGSGNSHVGYLCNCPLNPFVVKLVCLLSGLLTIATGDA